MARPTIILADGEVPTREMRAACIVPEPPEGDGVLRDYRRGGSPEAALRQTLRQMAAAGRGPAAMRAAGAALLAATDERAAMVELNAAARAGRVDAETHRRAVALLRRAGIALALQHDIEAGVVPVAVGVERRRRAGADLDTIGRYRCPDTIDLPGIAPGERGEP